MRHVDWVERAALGASALCLVHCIALPVVVAALPALASVLHLPESIHLWILLFAIPTSLLALLSGRARHGTRYPVLLGILGLGLLAIGALVFAHRTLETPITVAGSIFLAAAHVSNWRLRHAGHQHG